MFFFRIRILVILLCAGHISLTRAEIYKYTDSEGRVTYSSTPMKGAKKLDLEPPLTKPSTMPSPAPSAVPQPSARTHNNARNASPSDFPRVDNETQRNRDAARRKILADELATEEKLLAEARQSLKDGAENPETYVGKDGKVYRNTAKNDEKIKALQEQVSLHENNVSALKTELSRKLAR